MVILSNACVSAVVRPLNQTASGCNSLRLFDFFPSGLLCGDQKARYSLIDIKRSSQLLLCSSFLSICGNTRVGEPQTDSIVTES